MPTGINTNPKTKVIADAVVKDDPIDTIFVLCNPKNTIIHKVINKKLKKVRIY